MRLLLAALSLALLAVAPARAETRCEPAPAAPEVETGAGDILPTLRSYRPDFVCRSTDGLMLTPERDANGAPILRDLQGNRVEGRADQFGAIVYPDVETTLPAGPIRLDSFVNPVTGAASPATSLPRSVEQSPVDPYGNSVIRDKAGGIKRCWTNEWGVTSCD